MPAIAAPPAKPVSLPRTSQAVAVLAASIALCLPTQFMSGVQADEGTSATPAAEEHVCGLPEEELAERKALYERDVVPKVAELQRQEGALLLRMTSTSEDSKALADNMAALEAGCCAFLDISHVSENGTNFIKIAGPEEFLDLIAAWKFPEAASESSSS